MCRRLCEFARWVLEIVNVFFFFVGASLVATGIWANSELASIPGSTMESAIYGIIATGGVTMVISCVGLSGAQKRKREGSEKCGLLLLIIYAVVMAAIIISILAISISVYVWLGNELPVGQDSEKVQEGAQTANAVMENFMRCTFDSCCVVDQGYNTSMFTAVKCKLSEKDGKFYPDPKDGDEYFHNGKIPDGMEKDDIKKVCALAEADCLQNGTKAYLEFSNEVKEKLTETVSPIATALMIIACAMLVAWILALVEILWCCGKSDEVEPEYDDDEDEDIYS